MRFFDVHPFRGRVYLFLRYCFRLRDIGDIGLLGWDCMKSSEWDSLCDEVQKDLVRVRKKGHGMIKKITKNWAEEVLRDDI